MRRQAENLVKAFLQVKRNREQLTICLDRILDAAQRCMEQIPDETRKNLHNNHNGTWHPNGANLEVISLEKFQTELSTLVTSALTELTDPEALMDLGNGLISLANDIQIKLIDRNGK